MLMEKHILLVDADELLRRSLAEQLVGKDFIVTQAVSAAAAGPLAVVADLVLTATELPDATAAEFCGTLREGGFDRPIIVLGLAAAEGGSEGEGITGLAKPYRFSALIQLIEDRLRQSGVGQALRVGALWFHPLARQVVDETGTTIRLTEKESAILAYLHQAGDRVVPRDELLGEVWGYSADASTHTVETHIYRLRRKLEGGVGGVPLLITASGGYRLALAEGASR